MRETVQGKWEGNKEMIKSLRDITVEDRKEEKRA